MKLHKKAEVAINIRQGKLQDKEYFKKLRTL